MMNLYNRGLLFAPDAPGAGGAGGGTTLQVPGPDGPMGGSDPMGGDDQSGVLATLQGAGEGGSDPMGGDDGQELQEGSDPMGADTGQPAQPKTKQVPAGVKRPKPALNVISRTSAQSGPTDQGGGDQATTYADLDEGDRRLLKAAGFKPKQVNATLERFGVEAGLEYLREQAEIELGDDEDGTGAPQSAQTPQAEGEEEGAEANEDPAQNDENEDEASEGESDQGWQNGDEQPAERETPTPRPKTTAQQPRDQGGRYVPITPQQQTLEAVKAVLGDDAYNQVIAPVLKTVNAASQRVLQAEQTLNALIKHFNGSMGELQRSHTHQALDRLNSPVLGNSFEGLTPREEKLRGEAVKLANSRLKSRPGTSLASAVAYAVWKIEQKLANAGPHGAGKVQATTPQQQQAAARRQQQTGSVPHRGGSTRGGVRQNGAQPKQGLGAALEILTNGLPRMAGRGA